VATRQSVGTRAKDSDDRLVDLAKFDVDAIIGRVRGAPQILGTEQRDVKLVYFIVEPSNDPATPDAVQIAIHVSTNFGGGGYLAANISARYYGARCRYVLAAKQRRWLDVGACHPGASSRVAYAWLRTA